MCYSKIYIMLSYPFFHSKYFILSLFFFFLYWCDLWFTPQLVTGNCNLRGRTIPVSFEEYMSPSVYWTFSDDLQIFFIYSKNYLFTLIVLCSMVWMDPIYPFLLLLLMLLESSLRNQWPDWCEVCLISDLIVSYIHFIHLSWLGGFIFVFVFW